MMEPGALFAIAGLVVFGIGGGLLLVIRFMRVCIGDDE